ncbi:MAG: hypothetical protein U1E28_02000 [Beijerinckiaceae bacterium]
MREQDVQNEMRLFALESIVCQHLATFYHQLPKKDFETVYTQAIEGTRRQTFSGADASQSDLLSAELESAVDRLYKMIKSHLETNPRR